MAIALDLATAAGTWGTSASSFTTSLTITGANTILIASAFLNVGSNTTTSVTYNGNALSAITATTAGSGFMAAYYIVGQSGTHNAVWNKTGTDLMDIVYASYTGASQTGQPDSVTTGSDSASGTCTFTTTTVADNSWVFATFRNLDGGGTGGTNTTIDVVSGGVGASIIRSTAAVTPAGSASVILTSPAGRVHGKIIFSISPNVAVGPTNLKTKNGVAKASIKTIEGVAIASVKTANGIT